MDDIKALLLSLQRCWADLLDANRRIGMQAERIKELEEQLKSVSKEA